MEQEPKREIESTGDAEFRDTKAVSGFWTHSLGAIVSRSEGQPVLYIDA